MKSPTAYSESAAITPAFTASWNSVPLAESYLFDLSTSSTFVDYVTADSNLYQNYNTNLSTSLNIVGLTASNIYYYYRVRACNSSWTSSYSNVIKV